MSIIQPDRARQFVSHDGDFSLTLAPEQAKLYAKARQKARREAVPKLNLKALREATGLTQKQLALQLGISQDEISRLENQRRDPRLSTIVAYLEALNTKIEIHAYNQQTGTHTPLTA